MSKSHAHQQSGELTSESSYGVIPIEPGPNGGRHVTPARPPQPKGSSNRKCEQCGYDLTGLPTKRCPECGTISRPMTNERYLRSESARSNRESYLKPLLMMIIAGGITMTIHGISEGLGSALWYPLTFVIEVPIGVGVFFLCCLLWLGFDAPMHLTALRLAGIYAVVDLVAMAVGFIPFFGWLITLFVYIGLLSEMLEMELSDAVLVGFLTFVAKVAVGMGLVLLFANQ